MKSGPHFAKATWGKGKMMGDQDQQNGDGQSDQQNQTDGQPQTPGIPPFAKATGDKQAGAYRLSLTEAQRKKLVDEGVLDLS